MYFFAENMEDNPWLTSTLQDFTFICCPECVFRCQNFGTFQNHALENHPQSQCFFQSQSSQPRKHKRSKTRTESDKLQHVSKAKKIKVEVKQEPGEDIEEFEIQGYQQDPLELTAKDKIQCHQCSEMTTFVSKHALNHHRNKVHRKLQHLKTQIKSEIQCEICNEPMEHQTHLTNHRLEMHGVIPEGMFHCDHCPVFFKNESSLIKHKNSKHK